jgi:excisionase family DNA binding protein
MKRLLTVKEAAVFLKVKPATVRAAIDAGKFKAVQLGSREFRVVEGELHEAFGTAHPLRTAAEVCEALSIHPETLKKYTREGRIGSVEVTSWRSTRYREEDVNEFVEGLASAKEGDG